MLSVPLLFHPSNQFPFFQKLSLFSSSFPLLNPSYILCCSRHLLPSLLCFSLLLQRDTQALLDSRQPASPLLLSPQIHACFFRFLLVIAPSSSNGLGLKISIHEASLSLHISSVSPSSASAPRSLPLCSFTGARRRETLVLYSSQDGLE